MTKKETAQINELFGLYEGLVEKHDLHGQKIDKVLDALTGDELGNYEGLIEAQKKDNAFRQQVADQLDSIKKYQETQLGLNKSYNERLMALEKFVNFFTTLGQVKRSIWIMIGAFVTGIGWVIVKIQSILKWLTGFLDIQGGS